MKSENQNSQEVLRRNRPSIPWELALLIVLLVTVLGVSLRAPVKSFPHHDPYDLHSDQANAEPRNRVETGL